MQNLSKLCLSAFALVLSFIFASTNYNAQAGYADHVVISEVQISGSTSTDEFVELYNPLSKDVDLTGWEIVRKTASLNAKEELIITLAGTIPAKGFYLVAHTGYDGSAEPDQTYKTEYNISPDNSISLKSGSQTIDLLGMGNSATFEGATIDNPIGNRSIERKANSFSTNETMAPLGIDELMGNGEDTDNNAVDFVRHRSPVISNPQNSSADVEPANTNPTITPTEEQIQSPTPTKDPTKTPMPTEELTITPTPTEKPNDTPTPPVLQIPLYNISCTSKVKFYTITGMKLSFTYPICKLVRL